MTPVSVMFHVDDVDQDMLDSYVHEHKSPRFRKLILTLREAGEWTFPYEIFISVQLAEKGTMMINTIRLLGIDGTDGESKSDGMIRGREDVEKLFAVMQKHILGFANARIKAVGTSLGVRETRRIVDSYVLTVDDLREGKVLDDIIGYSAYGWDLPAPKRPSYNPSHGKRPEVAAIPYRILVPAPIENLLCPGRAFCVGPLARDGPLYGHGRSGPGHVKGHRVRSVVRFGSTRLRSRYNVGESSDVGPTWLHGGVVISEKQREFDRSLARIGGSDDPAATDRPFLLVGVLFRATPVSPPPAGWPSRQLSPCTVPLVLYIAHFHCRSFP